MTLSKSIGIRLKELLEERKVTQYYLFKTGGIPRCTISNIVRAKKGACNVDTIYQITSTLEISLKEFFNSPIFNEVDD